MSRTTLRDLIGDDLSQFKIVEMTEVYRENDDGRKNKSLGYFKNPIVAHAFAGTLTDANWHKTAPALVLTDGTVGFVVSQEEPVKLFCDEEVALQLRKQLIARLSLADRELLGLVD